MVIRQSDIAKELNVSRVTVSKALRDHPDISPELKERIKTIAREMGYIPNLIARQLNSNKSFTIGIVIPDLENHFFSYIVDSMIDYASEINYQVILTVSREKERIETQNIKNLIGMRVDGLLVCLSQETTDKQIFNTVSKLNIPLVFFDRAFENMGFSQVVFNDKSGAISSLNSIIKEGYTKFANFAGFSKTNIGKERSEGFIEALASNNISIRKDWIIEGGFEVEDGYRSFNKLNALGNLPEIIFTVNDRVALGVYKAAKEAGLIIPDDIGLISFGFHEITDFFDPPLTVINQDPREMGLAAITVLINEINSKTECTERKIFIEEEFYRRKSIK